MTEKVLKQNPHPNKDQTTNLISYFKIMDEAVKGYCSKTPGTESVLSNYNKAKTEFDLVKQGKGDSTKIVAALHTIAHSNYVAPPAPPTPPARPASGPPAGTPQLPPQIGTHRK